MVKQRSILLLFAGCLIYFVLFLQHEQHTIIRKPDLTVAQPAVFYRVVSGYLRQISASLLFINTSVYLGDAIQKKIAPSSYGQAAMNNLLVTNQLHPRFLPAYYYAQAFLPEISTELAAATNRLLEKGFTARPDDIILRFFYGSNYVLAMNQPEQAANAFIEAAKLPDAPPIFAHLAALLQGQAGSLQAGLFSLKILYENEKNPDIQKRYSNEMHLFEQAITMNDYVQLYKEKTGKLPEKLEMLIPQYLSKLPDFSPHFQLVWEPPQIKLIRPIIQAAKPSDTLPLK